MHSQSFVNEYNSRKDEEDAAMGVKSGCCESAGDIMAAPVGACMLRWDRVAASRDKATNEMQGKCLPL